MVKYFFSESGYLNGDIWALVLDEFATIWSNLYPGLVATVLTDNLEFHHDIEPLRAAAAKFVELFFLPPNTSHFTQPLDDLVFAVLKQQLEQIALKLASAYANQGKKKSAMEIVTAAAVLASKVALTKDKITSSFRNTFMFPFDPTQLMAAARANIGEVPEADLISLDGPIQVSQIRAAAQRVIATEYAAEGRVIKKVEKVTKRITASVKYKKSYSSAALIALNEEEEKAQAEADEVKRANQEEKEAKQKISLAKKRQRELDLQVRTCRVPGCGLVCNQRNGKLWMWCEHCDAYAICRTDWEAGNNGPGHRLMADHEAQCGRPKKRSRKSKD